METQTCLVVVLLQLVVGAGGEHDLVPFARVNELSIAVAVVSSDKRVSELAPAILRTWAREASRVVIFVDSPDAARKWDRLSKAASHGTVAVAQCCPNNSSLGDSLSTAQYKLEHTFARMLSIAPNASFYVFSDDDTYWNMQLLHRTISAASAWIDPSMPTALYPGRPAGAMPGYSFCQTSGPFMIMNRALVSLLGEKSVMDDCRALVMSCYDVYKTRREILNGFLPTRPFGDCPRETQAWKYPKPGSMYNNDHLVNVCTARHHLLGSANAICLPGFEFDIVWAICGKGSPYWHHRDWAHRAFWCRAFCNITIGCPLEKIVKRNMDRLSSAQVPLFIHNEVGVSLSRFAAAMEHGESLVFGSAPVEPPRAQRILDSIVAYHHATAGDMDWMYARRSDVEKPHIRALTSWPRAWRAKVSVEYWLRRSTGVSFRTLQ